MKEYTLDIDFNIEKTPGLDYDRMLYNRLLEEIKKNLSYCRKNMKKYKVTVKKNADRAIVTSHGFTSQFGAKVAIKVSD